MIRVKICGITSPEDARLTVAAGADAIGLVFAESPRRVDLVRARAILEAVGPFVTPVAVFVDSPLEEIRTVTEKLGITTVQLHGLECPEKLEELRPLKVIRGVRVGGPEDLEELERSQADAFLLDARVPGKMGGTGVTFDSVSYTHLTLPTN